MNSKIEKFAYYSQEQAWLSQQILFQSNPITAHGEGLDKIAKVIEIEPRKTINGRLETDEKLRDRIIDALGGYLNV